MPDAILNLSVPTTATPLAPQDRASPKLKTAVIVASDQFALWGMAGLFGQVHSISAIKAHGSIDAAMSGPPATLVVVHTGTSGLTASRVTALLEQRQAGALLAAEVSGTGGLTALRAAGARGLLTAAETPELCASLIQLALAGCCCWPATAATDPDESRLLHSIPDPAFALTARQRDVTALLARGHCNKVIADTLRISEGTAKIHLTAIFLTLGVSNRAMAVAHLLPHFGSLVCSVSAAERRGERP